jgi:hypothetical protein
VGRMSFKRWVDELSSEELKYLRKYLDSKPFVNRKHIIDGVNKMVVLIKESFAK